MSVIEDIISMGKTIDLDVSDSDVNEKVEHKLKMTILSSSSDEKEVEKEYNSIIEEMSRQKQSSMTVF